MTGDVGGPNSPLDLALTVHTSLMNVRVDDELCNALAELAEAEGVSAQEIVRRAVLDRHARARRAALDAVVERMLAEWGDTLGRLRQT